MVKYRLKDLFNLFAGGDIDTEHFSQYKTPTHCFPIYSNSLNNKGLYGYTSVPKYKGNAITITGRGSVGHAEYRKQDFDAIIRLLILIPQKADVVNSYYLTQFINQYVSFPLESTGVPQLTVPQIENIEVELPDFAEQATVAEALSDIDSLISSLQKLIEKKKAIKQGAMQELLTGKKRLPGFSGEWNEGRIGDYCQCIRGVSYNGGTDLFSDENNYSFRLLRANNIQNGHFVPNDVQFVIKSCVPEERVLHTDDILVCMANGSKPLVGKNCFLNVRNGVYTFGAFMGCVRARTPSTCMKYIFQIMNSTTYCGNISLLLSGSSINNLRPNDILNMTYKFPTVIEQQDIAQVLSDMDSEIEKLEKKLSKYQQVKQGMMQELLTGRIRLVDIDSKEQLPAQGVQEKQPQEEG